MSAQAEADEVIAQLRAEVLVMQESAGAEAILVANAAAGASWSQPRTWSEFIHELIGRQWVGRCRSDESCDCVIGVAEVPSGVGEGLLDSMASRRR